MNPIGIYYAFLCTTDTVDWHDCIERTARAGADILEGSAPRMLALPKDERAQIARHAKDAGVRLTLAVALSPDTNIASANSAIHQAGVDLLKRDIDLAAEIGAEAIGGIITGVSKDFPEGIEYTKNQVLDGMVPGLGQVAHHAQAAGVCVGLEVVNRFESPLVNTAAEALRVVQAVDNPALGVHLDTFHMNIEEKNLPNAIRLAGKHLIHFHACENDRSLPGQGHVDWAGVFAALKDIGYQGRIVMESLPGPYGTLAQRMHIWRSLSRDVDAELKQAVQFIRQGMEG